MNDFEYVKQVAVQLTFNPASGLITHFQNMMQNLVLSSRRSLIISHELMAFDYFSSTGQPLSAHSVNVAVYRSLPVSQLNDSVSFVPGSFVTREGAVSSQLYFRESGPTEKPVNMVVDANQQITVSVTINFSALTGSMDVVSLFYRLFFREL